MAILVMAFVFLAASAQAAPSVFVSITPQKYFVDKVSAGKASVSIMIEPGANPHAYEPKPRQMAELAKASVYFTIGDSFDQTWLDRIMGASPGIVVVHTAEGIEKLPMGGQPNGDGHEHHDGQERHAEESHAGETHGHGTLDPHIWLDPALVRIQVGHVRDGLIRVHPAGEKEYAANAAAFLRELDVLDAEIRATLAVLPANRRTFLVFHPSWGYFAKAYGLTQVAIEVEGKEPSPKDLARIIAMGKERGARVVFVQPQFSEKSAAVIAKQIGATIVRLDPLAADWAHNLRQAAGAFVEALK
jgi:zinc transport system substrate-binding protein